MGITSCWMYRRSLSKNALCLSIFYCKCLQFYIDWSVRSEMPVVLPHLSAKKQHSGQEALSTEALRPEGIILRSRTHPSWLSASTEHKYSGGPEHMDVRRSGFRRDAAHGLRWWWGWWTIQYVWQYAWENVACSSQHFERSVWRMIKAGRLLMRKFILIWKKLILPK